MDDNWMKHDSLQGIDPAKLQMLSQMAAQGQQQTKSQADLMPFLMMAANSSKEKGMQFSGQEMSMIIEVLKMGKSPQEVAQMDQMLSLLKMMKR